MICWGALLIEFSGFVCPLRAHWMQDPTQEVGADPDLRT